MPITERSKNIVYKNSKVKLSKREAEKNYRPGVYTQHHPSQCEHELQERSIHLQKDNAMEGKEIYKIVERDNIRDLLVPGKNKNVHPSIWRDIDYNRIKSESKVQTLSDRNRALEHREADKRNMADECEKRKILLKEIDRQSYEKRFGRKFNTFDDVDDDKKVLEKYVTAKHEDEEEVRRANRIILSTKCQVIRDAQIAEKQEIEKELKEENLKLEKMINEKVELALKEEEVERLKKKKLNEKHASDLKSQLERREKTKTLHAEKIDQEAKMMAKAQIAIDQDQRERERQRREKIEKTRRELQRANEISQQLKRLEFEEQRIADLKVQEYMRLKKERDAHIAREKRLEAEQKERERERLLNLQKRIIESKQAQTSQVFRREQEEKEREFRRKEKEAALKKKKMLEEIGKARDAQLEELKRARAFEIAKEEEEYLKTCEKLKKELDQEQKMIIKREKDNERYRSEIIGQMNEREMNRREQLRKAKEDLHAKQEAEKERIRTIRAVVQQKIQNMKDNKVPEKFIKDVERQLETITSGNIV